MRISDWSSDVCSSDLNDRVLIALLGEADYRAASFLDQRLLTDRVGREWRAWNALPDLGAAAPRPDFIFHIGHVGSTLVSRLLAEVGDALPLRADAAARVRSEEHTSELQSLMRISYAVFCLKKTKQQTNQS